MNITKITLHSIIYFLVSVLHSDIFKCLWIRHFSDRAVLNLPIKTNSTEMMLVMYIPYIACYGKKKKKENTIETHVIFIQLVNKVESNGNVCCKCTLFSI